MKVYTRTGDQGETGLYDGTRVLKSEQIFEVLGTIDELSAHVGVLMFNVRNENKILYSLKETTSKELNPLKFLEGLQQKLLNIGSIIATPNPREGLVLPIIDGGDVHTIEAEIDMMDTKLKPLTTFLLQLGHSGSEAQAHVCRTLTRRCERELLKYGNVDENICIFMNRLSDYFFTLARLVK